MGKKSKKNAGGGGGAKTKSAISTVRSSGDSGATKNRDGTGGVLTSSGGTSSKKERCVLCCALLKDLAKAHQCPGCSLLYCWRCERKDFRKCPNEDNCIRPILNCKNCTYGITMERELVAAGAIAPDKKMTMADSWIPRIRTAYEEIVLSRPDLTDDSWPRAMCGASGCASCIDVTFEEMLASAMECIHCAVGPSPSKLLSCCRCKKIRCVACSDKSDKFERFDAACDQLNDSIGRGDELSNPSVITACWNTYINAGGSDTMYRCITCRRRLCLKCMDFTEQKRIIRTMWECNNDICLHYSDGFQCSSCYWASKPCTNPNCPNEVGVPTKRCGGCHLDRYCSVECQAAMYPDHMERCQKIQEKRAAAGKGLPMEK